MLLRAWLSDWLNLKSPRLKPRTIESYSYLIDRHIVPAIGSQSLSQLSPLVITHMLANIAAEGHSRTAEMCYVLLRSALKGVCPAMEGVVRPSHRQKSPAAWSDGQIAAYLPAMAQHRHALAFSLAIFLGLRRGEICGLRWCDIDFSQNLIHIVNQRQRLSSGQVLDMPPKSETSARVLPIPPQLLPLLKSRRQLAGYLCPISPNGLDTAHRTLVRGLDLPYIPLHGLRHTMATACIRHGGSMKSLQLLLGHSSYATTANRYTHPDCEMLAAALDRVMVGVV